MGITRSRKTKSGHGKRENWGCTFIAPMERDAINFGLRPVRVWGSVCCFRFGGLNLRHQNVANVMPVRNELEGGLRVLISGV